MERNEIPTGLIESIRENGLEIHYKTGELVFKQNTPLTHLYLIETGLVKIIRETKNQREIMLDIGKPGDFPGLQSLWNHNVSENNVIALEPTRMILVDFSTFQNLILNIPEYAHYLLKLMSNQSELVINRLIAISQKQLPGRVADLMLFFLNLYNHQMSFHLPLNRTEMAQFAGTTKESMIRTLAEFKSDRIIELNDREVTINSLDIIKILSRHG